MSHIFVPIKIKIQEIAPMTQTKSPQQFTLANVDGSVIIYLKLQSNGSYQRRLISDAFISDNDNDNSINKTITEAISAYFSQNKDVKSGYYFIVRADENTICVENIGYFFEDAIEKLQKIGYFFEDAIEKLQKLNIVIPFIEGESQRTALIPFENEDSVAREDIQFDGRICFQHHIAEEIIDDESE